MSDVVIVLGMHRSGTSAVAGVLSKLGGALPKTIMASNGGNPRGYFESRSFMDFHDELLDSAGSRWSDWRQFSPTWYKSLAAQSFRERAKELFKSEFDEAPLSILKDPRICRFTPFWLNILEEMGTAAKVVIPIRSPLEVARSLKRREGMAVTEGLLLWLRHVLDAELQSRNATRSIFAWDQFISDWRQTTDKIARETGIEWPRVSDRSRQEIENFLDAEFVHEHVDDEELRGHPEVHEWALQAYEALLELGRNPFSNSAAHKLDQLRELFEQSSAFFGPLLISYEVELESLEVLTDAVRSERDLLRTQQTELNAQLTEAHARHEHSSAELNVRNKELRAVSDKLAEAEAALAESLRSKNLLSEGLDARTAELATVAGERDETSAKLHAIEKELAAALGALERTEAAHTETAQHRDQLSADLQARTAELAAAVAERQQTAAELRSVSEELGATLNRCLRAEETAIRSKAELDATTSALALANEENSELKAVLAVRVAELSALSEENKQLATELESRNREAREGKETAARLQKNFEKSQRAVVQAQAEHGKLVSDLSARTLQFYGASKEKQQLASVLADRNQKLDEALTALDARQAELDAALRRHSDIAAELENAHSERQKSEILLEQVTDEKREVLTSLSARNGELENLREETMREKERLEGEINRISAELLRVEKASADHLVKLDAAHAGALNEMRRGFETEIRLLRDQLVDAETALARNRSQGSITLRLPNVMRREERVILESGLFDAEWYKSEYKDAAASKLSPVRHFLELGYLRGYRPNPFFDTRWYLDSYEDVRRSGLNPLLHYVLNGYREGRDPGPGFQTNFYLLANPDVRAQGVNPLAHYLRYGRAEGRTPVRSKGKA